MIPRVAALFPFLVLCARAQFFGLATPGDGSTLYFATPLQQKNTTQPDYGKLFRFDASGLNLQESLPYQPLPPSDDVLCLLGSPYDIRFADVSSDATVLAVTALRDISSGFESDCPKQNSSFVTTILQPPFSLDVPDYVRLSANGRWAFGGTGTPLFSSTYGYLVNLETRQETVLGQGSPPLNQFGFFGVIQFQVSSNGRPVANDGTAVFSDMYALVVIEGSQISRVPLPNSGKPADAVIDAGAHLVVYSEEASGSLGKLDLASGAISTLAADGNSPSISDDGSTVLYLSSSTGTPQVWMIHTDGSGDQQLTKDPLGIKRAILSGDASIAYAVTLEGQLIQITIASGQIQTLIPRTPYIDPGQLATLGELSTLTGEGISDSSVSAAPPLPYTLDNIQVTIQGEPTVIQSIQPTSITVVPPPDLTPPPGEYAPLQLQVVSPSPFASPTIPVLIGPPFPEFLSNSGYIIAAHENWSGLVTANDPALPGEIVHAYAVGLGPTTPAVPYGAPAPAREPLARLTTPYQCGNGTITANVPVLYQGLAPDLLGIYQMDLQIPPDAEAGDFGLDCWITLRMGIVGGEIPVGQ